MLAQLKSVRAVFLAVALSLFCGSSAYPQTTHVFLASKNFHSGVTPGVWRAKCAIPPGSLVTRLRPFDEIGPRAFVDGAIDDAYVSSAVDNSCLSPGSTSDPVPDASVKTANPCRLRAGTDATRPASPSIISCADSPDTIPDELAAFGKEGLKIEHAREAVLEILRSQNACSEWFEGKEAAAAWTFQSLHFAIDQRGPRIVFESKSDPFLVIYRQPYVARSTQDGGGFTTITVNANGAFFRIRGQVQKAFGEGGPIQMDGTRLLTVGSYDGDTLPAQTVTLLHEFGHIIDLLPEDADGLDGKSGQNTNEVLKHCRSEVEILTRPAKQLAKR